MHQSPSCNCACSLRSTHKLQQQPAPVALTRLARTPVCVMQPLLDDGQHDGQQLVAKVVGQHVQPRCAREGGCARHRSGGGTDEFSRQTYTMQAGVQQEAGWRMHTCAHMGTAGMCRSIRSALAARWSGNRRWMAKKMLKLCAHLRCCAAGSSARCHRPRLRRPPPPPPAPPRRAPCPCVVAMAGCRAWSCRQLASRAVGACQGCCCCIRLPPCRASRSNLPTHQPRSTYTTTSRQPPVCCALVHKGLDFVVTVGLVSGWAARQRPRLELLRFLNLLVKLLVGLQQTNTPTELDWSQKCQGIHQLKTGRAGTKRHPCLSGSPFSLLSPCF